MLVLFLFEPTVGYMKTLYALLNIHRVFPNKDKLIQPIPSTELARRWRLQ